MFGFRLFLISCDKRGHSSLLRGVVEVDEAYFGYKKQNNKRGRGTEKAKVLAAVSTDEMKKYPRFAKMKAVNRLTSEVVIDFVKSHFKENCLVQTDGLNIYYTFKYNVNKHEIFPIVY